jgi:hypothetical protein
VKKKNISKEKNKYKYTFVGEKWKLEVEETVILVPDSVARCHIGP